MPVNPIFTKIRDKHALWYKGLVFFACVAICTYLLPKHPAWQVAKLKAGDIWHYDNLIATTDFLIHKTDQELASDNIKNDQKKIFYFKKNGINTSQLLKGKAWENNPEFERKLDSIYKTGYYYSIAGTPHDYDSIYLVSGNEVQLIASSKLFESTKVSALLKKFFQNDMQLEEFVSDLPSNIIYDDELNKQLYKESLQEKYIYKTKVKSGEMLLSKNDVITKEKINLINSYRAELQTGDSDTPYYSLIAGQFLACMLILGIMMLFLAFFRKTIFSQNTHVTFIFLTTVLIMLAASIINKYNSNYIYAVPFCLIPILIRVFFDSRTALFNFLNIILLCSFFTSDKFEFIFIQLITGIGTIFSVADMGKRSKLFISSLLTFTFYLCTFTTYHLINNTSILLKDINNFVPFLISSLCVLFAFPLIYLFEKLFGFVSDFTLLELCDLNFPLLRELSQKIPGTFQHSLQVANLAEEACYKTGGNALLVRTGAMYHDVGKMENPRFFTENQVGEVSPHEDMSPEDSAKIIIGHVIKGIEKAKEYKLPEAVIDFIRTHHGTTTTRYFLHNYKKEHAGEIINEELFRYPGPIPFSKETAILMMADGVEAASRSLKKYDAITIDELVDKIINHQINENQFINADITFRDINQIKKIFKKRLMSIYHVRIEYPR